MQGEGGGGVAQGWHEPRVEVGNFQTVRVHSNTHRSKVAVWMEISPAAGFTKAHRNTGLGLGGLGIRDRLFLLWEGSEGRGVVVRGTRRMM
jgi:hypothetical protein